MARNSIIRAVITGDATGLNRTLDGAGGSMSRFARNTGLAFAGIGAAVGGAVAIGKPLVDAASAWEEAAGKVGVVFGDAATAVQDFADTSATTFGISSSDALAAAGSFGVLGDAAGLAGTDLSSFATDLVGAAADFGSFNDLDPSEVLGKLQSGLAGEAEPLRQLGVFLNDATLSARAFELGMGDSFSALSDGEKILVRQAEIMEQLGSTGAAGDFARTSGGLANQQRILKARFADVQVELGQKLLPVALKVAEVAIDLVDGFSRVIDVFSEQGLTGVLDGLSERFAIFATIREIVETAVNAISAVWDKVGDEVIFFVTRMKDVIEKRIKAIITVLDGIIDFVRSVFTGDWGKAWEAIGQIFEGTWDFITGLVDQAWVTLQAGVRVILEGVKALWNWSFLSDIVGDAINGAVGFFTGLPAQLLGVIPDLFAAAQNVGGAIINGIANGVRGAAGFVGDFARGIGNAVIRWVNNNVIGAINSAIPNSVGLGPFGSINLPDNPIPRIPSLASGGIVDSPTLALIGEAGPEAVIPLDQLRGGGGETRIVIELDGKVIAEAVAEANTSTGGVFAA